MHMEETGATSPIQAAGLLVDDDTVLTSLLANELGQRGFRIDIADSGEDGLDRLRAARYEFAIVDVMLPRMNGFELLAHIRDFSSIPVLMLTARGNPMDVDLGFRFGADDYLSKPFQIEELSWRIRAILRRATPGTAPAALVEPASGRNAAAADSAPMVVGNLVVKPMSHEALISGTLLDLTSAEYAVLRSLARTPGEVVMRTDLCRTALGREPQPLERTVDNLVASLRRKFEAVSEKAPAIKSARGQGYFLVLR